MHALPQTPGVQPGEIPDVDKLPFQQRQEIHVDSVEVQYFDADGRMVASERSLPLQPGAGWTFSQKDNPNLPLGFLGSAVVISDQPIAVLKEGPKP